MYPCLFPDDLIAQHVFLLPVIVTDTSRARTEGTVELRTIGPWPNTFGVDWTDLVGAHAIPLGAAFDLRQVVSDMATLPPGCEPVRAGELRKGQHVRWAQVQAGAGFPAAGERHQGVIQTAVLSDTTVVVHLVDGRWFSLDAQDIVIVGPK